MKTIAIIINDLELDYVATTLTIKKDNNAFSTDFKIAHSSNPFLIVENENTANLLGPRDITSISKIKTIEVVIIEHGLKYFGELEVLSYVKGFRKCNIRYASALLPVLKQQLAEFMPVVSIIPNETNPEPYVETAEALLNGSEFWPEYVTPFLNQSFPQVKWQFPTMRWLNKFGENLEEGTQWFDYQNQINKVDFANGLTLIENTYDVPTLNVSNKNIISPQVYLLAPLFYIAEQIGYKITGDFVSNSFIRRLLFLSTKNNLTEVKITPNPEIYNLDPIAFVNQTFLYDFTTRPYKVLSHSQPSQSHYILKYKFKIKADNVGLDWGSNRKYCRLFFNSPNAGYTALFDIVIYQNALSVTIEGEHSFYIDAAAINNLNTNIVYMNDLAQNPLEYSLEIVRVDETIPFMQMNPTLELSRFVPEWTVAKYFKELKNTFNLTIEADDFKKNIALNFNEAINTNVIPEVLSKSFQVKNYENVTNSSFTLSYQNEEDAALYITKTTTEVFTTQIDSNNQKIQNGFKFVDNIGYTAELSEALENKAGVGLMIYDTNRRPYTSLHYLNKTLDITGENGIYSVFWKRWLKFRLNASVIEIEGPFTETELNKIALKKEIYIDNQHYRIVSYQFAESSPGINKVAFTLESVNL